MATAWRCGLVVHGPRRSDTGPPCDLPPIARTLGCAGALRTGRRPVAPLRSFAVSRRTRREPRRRLAGGARGELAKAQQTFPNERERSGDLAGRGVSACSAERYPPTLRRPAPLTSAMPSSTSSAPPPKAGVSGSPSRSTPKETPKRGVMKEKTERRVAR